MGSALEHKKHQKQGRANPIQTASSIVFGFAIDQSRHTLHDTVLATDCVLSCHRKTVRPVARAPVGRMSGMWKSIQFAIRTAPNKRWGKNNETKRSAMMLMMMHLGLIVSEKETIGANKRGKHAAREKSRCPESC
ncbi:zinc finger homeobox protein 2 [Anopheles sinensis]|uniref:Zinc finger homeobox protein 2 n=1 Tax=Anopheles sinensis TaxID=74873 RepID=A0A084WSP1_ANOSI|nr:zinc finger homeobox protein 2 [Anopheles sinensis]